MPALPPPPESPLALDPKSIPDPPLRRSTHLSAIRPIAMVSHTSLLATLPSGAIPNSYSQAVRHECWQKALRHELDAPHANHTWDIVPCPAVKPTGYKSGGSLDRYKARLVALGNRQEYGIDYDETFATVAKMTTVRTVLAIVTSQSWPLY